MKHIANQKSIMISLLISLMERNIKRYKWRVKSPKKKNRKTLPPSAKVSWYFLLKTVAQNLKSGNSFPEFFFSNKSWQSKKLNLHYINFFQTGRILWALFFSVFFDFKLFYEEMKLREGIAQLQNLGNTGNSV